MSRLLSLLSFLILVAVHRVEASLVYRPPASYKIPRVLYARTLALSDGGILATWEDYGPEPPYFPIYKSKDNGKTWSEISRAKDTVNGWGLRYQPFLYQLPEPFGGFPAGTVLLAGSAIPENLSKTQLDLYASTDLGVTWKFVSHIARGGKAVPNNGETPVWEPFLMMHKGKLVYYYSDQRDPKHGQKLVHQVTSDLRRWEPLVDDTTYKEYKLRPGMTTVAKLPDGRFIMTYENCGESRGCPLHYRIASDPLRFNSAPDKLLKLNDGSVPNGSPYVVWTPAGGPHGTIVVSCGGKSELFLNKNLGNGTWVKTRSPASTSYTRSLLVLPNKNILIVGAGVLNGKNNTVTAETFEVR